MKRTVRILLPLLLVLAALNLMQSGCGGSSDSDTTDTAAVGTTNADGTVNVATTNAIGTITLGLLNPVSGAISWRNVLFTYSMVGNWSGTWTDGSHTTSFTMSLNEDTDGNVGGTYQEGTGLHGNVTGHRNGNSVQLSSPLSDGTVMTFEGTFSDTTHVGGNNTIHYTSGTSGPYVFAMHK
jgi:hypothetical protein